MRTEQTVHATASNDPFGAAAARQIPALPQWDSTLALLADPYRFIASACRQAGADAVQGRLMLQPTICLTGVRAAELFYDRDRFQRAGAAPEPLRATLFGKGGVQGLDGTGHAHRKALFLSLTGATAIDDLVQIASAEWAPCLYRWRGKAQAPLYAVAQDWLMGAACAWLGLGLSDADRRRRTQQTVSLFDAAASGALRHLGARRNRRAAEQWIARRIAAERRDPGHLQAGSAAQALAHHRDADGALLPERIAAVELLNLLRPVVAVSVFVVFVVHALESDAVSQAILREGDSARYLRAFVQEVRRRYPFFPAVAASTRCAFDWHGYHFPAGRRVLLDLYGTNHDCERWSRPREFRPERFMRATPGPFDLVAQGGGDATTGHRCPGEGATVALMSLAVQLLLHETHYRLPPQDLRLDMRRLPAMPMGGFVVEQLRSR